MPGHRDQSWLCRRRPATVFGGYWPITLTLENLMNAKGAPPLDLDPQLIEELIGEYRGNLAAVAKRLGVARSTIHNRVNANPHLQEVLHDARESLIDHAESVLHKNVMNGLETSLIFFLKTQGYKRGYGRQGHYDPDQAENLDRPATVADIDRAIARVSNSERGTS